MSGYSSFARYYDALTRNVAYSRRAAYFHQIIQMHYKGPGLLLDLACGTGSLSVEFAALGYEVIGADVSGEMLSVAMQKALEAERQILFLRQSMQKLDLYGTVQFCICALDSLNHLPDEASFRCVFERLFLFVEPGGLVIFDLNTVYKHRYILAENAYVYDLPEVYCVWQNQYCEEDDRVDIMLDFFEQDGDRYVRVQEQFSEWIYQDELVKNILQETGFDFVAVYGDDTLEPPQDETQRLVYVAKRRED